MKQIVMLRKIKSDTKRNKKEMEEQESSQESNEGRLLTLKSDGSTNWTDCFRIYQEPTTISNLPRVHLIIFSSPANPLEQMYSTPI